MAERISLIIASDSNYLCHATVAMLSVLETSKNPEIIDFYFLDEGIGHSNQAYLAQEISRLGGSIHFIDIDKRLFETFFISGHIKTPTYYRIVAPKLLPSSVHKAIYLDSDLLLMEDVAELYSIDIGSATIAAVEDPIERDEAFIHSLSKTDRRYFNAGILVINLDFWRQEGVTDKLFAYIQEKGELKYHDQDALNIVFDGKWHRLPARWNVQTTFFKLDEYKEACSTPALVHFTTKVKPWHLFSDHPYKEAYMHYRELTKWKDTPLINALLHEKLKSGSKLIVFGTGAFAQKIVENLQFEVSYFLDNNKEKTGSLFFGKAICLPEQLLLEQKDTIAIVIGSTYIDEITAQLESMGFEKNKQIFDLH